MHFHKKEETLITTPFAVDTPILSFQSALTSVQKIEIEMGRARHRKGPSWFYGTMEDTIDVSMVLACMLLCSR